MARVSFPTRQGRVSFTTTGKRKRARAKKVTPSKNPFAYYVKKNIGKFMAKGQSAPQAMKSCAAAYRRGR